jgi:hypothetical protein
MYRLPSAWWWSVAAKRKAANGASVVLPHARGTLCALDVVSVPFGYYQTGVCDCVRGARTHHGEELYAFVREAPEATGEKAGRAKQRLKNWLVL